MCKGFFGAPPPPKKKRSQWKGGKHLAFCLILVYFHATSASFPPTSRLPWLSSKIYVFNLYCVFNTRLYIQVHCRDKSIVNAHVLQTVCLEYRFMYFRKKYLHFFTVHLAKVPKNILFIWLQSKFLPKNFVTVIHEYHVLPFNSKRHFDKKNVK